MLQRSPKCHFLDHSASLNCLCLVCLLSHTCGISGAPARKRYLLVSSYGLESNRYQCTCRALLLAVLTGRRLVIPEYRGEQLLDALWDAHDIDRIVRERRATLHLPPLPGDGLAALSWNDYTSRVLHIPQVPAPCRPTSKAWCERQLGACNYLSSPSSCRLNANPLRVDNGTAIAFFDDPREMMEAEETLLLLDGEAAFRLQERPLIAALQERADLVQVTAASAGMKLSAERRTSCRKL